VEPFIPLARLEALPYVKPKQGREYWLLDGALRDPELVRARALARMDWAFGAPRRAEPWPGQRAPGALLSAELAPIERWVRQVTGARSLWQAEPEAGATLDHNIVQAVGAAESGPRPHSDSRRLCRFAAVLYLHPRPDPEAGTSFFRLRLPDGRLGGNSVPPPHANLPEALGVRGLPLQAWSTDLSLPNTWNRLLLYRGDLVHSATRYFGSSLEDKRLTAVCFWMARM
jgi:hypothetical protein